MIKHFLLCSNLSSLLPVLSSMDLNNSLLSSSLLQSLTCYKTIKFSHSCLLYTQPPQSFQVFFFYTLYVILLFIRYTIYIMSCLPTWWWQANKVKCMELLGEILQFALWCTLKLRANPSCVLYACPTLWYLGLLFSSPGKGHEQHGHQDWRGIRESSYWSAS